MRTRFIVPAVLSIVMTSAFAGDENSAPPSTKPTIAFAKATPPAWAPATKREARPEIAAIIYYSTKAEIGPLATPASRLSILHALEGVRQAKKSPEEGGLGVVGGVRDVEVEWAQFVYHLTPSPDPRVFKSGEDRQAQAEKDAEALRPYLRMGGCVLVLENAQDKRWAYGYTILSRATSGCGQISFMIDEHDRKHPDVAAEDKKLRTARVARLASPARATGTSNPVGTVAPTQPSIVKNVSTNSGGQQ